MKPWQINETADLIGWTPFDLIAQPHGQAVKWVDLGDARFDEPFFGRTISRRLASTDARVAITGLETLRELAQVAHHLQPNGFIFHMSRVGSTLLANALKADERNLVIAEPSPVNQLLRSPFRHSAKERWNGWMAGLIAALGQPRPAGQSRYVVKFSSHNILKIDLIRRAFPDVPWLFLYRDPVEVLVSNLGDPPGWHQLYQDPQAAENVLGLPPDRLKNMSYERFFAEVLRSFCEAALAAASSGGAFLNYRQLTPESIGAIGGVFGISADPRNLERVQSVFRFDSKADGKQAFTPNEGAKRQEPPPEICELCESLLSEPYQRMEELRLTV